MRIQLVIKFLYGPMTLALLAMSAAQAQETADTLAEQEKAANYQPAANPAPRSLDGGVIYPLFAGLDDATVPAYTIDPETDANSEAFDGVDVWGAAYDDDNHQVYFSAGIDLWVWPADGGAPVFLATVTDTTKTNVVMEGLAYFDGSLFASKVSSTGEGEGIYEINLMTFEATRVITYADDSQTTISGIDFDRDTGTLYGVNDSVALRGLVQIDPDGSVTVITDYMAGETDVDGLAVGDGRAYLITDDQTPPWFEVWDFATASYVTPVSTPFTTTEVFAAGAWIEVEGGGGGGGEARATFPVTKDFDDNNPSEVSVTISCNTGLPLEQTTTISEGDGVVFVVGDFNDGEMDCEISEDPVPEGYSTAYFENAVLASTESCVFENVGFGDENSCGIVNLLQQVDVVVTKEWIDENPQFNSVNLAEAEWECSNVASGDAEGLLEFLGNPGEDTFSVFPSWDGGTDCSVAEVSIPDGGVGVDDSACDSIVVFPGVNGSCTIVNTRLFEGIPTLSQYGLALLAMLMLGLGFVAVRRVA